MEMVKYFTATVLLFLLAFGSFQAGKDWAQEDCKDAVIQQAVNDGVMAVVTNEEVWQTFVAICEGRTRAR